MNWYKWAYFLPLLFWTFSNNAQNFSGNFFSDIILKIDTLQFQYSKNQVSIKGINYLGFQFEKGDETCEINVFPNTNDEIKSLELIKSQDYVITDSIVFLNNQYFRFKIKFTNLFKSEFLNLTFQVLYHDAEKNTVSEIKLFPYTNTNVQLNSTGDELYIGEEKIFELLSNHIENIKLKEEWTSYEDINYRLSHRNGILRLHLLPVSLGTKYTNIKLETFTPSLKENKKPEYQLPVISVPFKIKASRLGFLNVDKKEITYDDDTRRNGTEITLESQKSITIGKTYRIENQEQPGGPLIAELFTKSNLSNDKVLCILRPYNLHRQTEGYLYIKDGDDARFITNFNITPKTTINSIQILRSGQEWTSNLSIYPGETIDLKIEGEGFHKARFHWEEVIDMTRDTATRNENICYFKVQIPLGVSKRKIFLYNNTINTGLGLNVREYQVPRNFDFVTLNFGSGEKKLHNVNSTVIQRRTINDIVLSFDNRVIDENNKLYGKQYFDLDIKLLGRRGELIEMKTIRNILICPGDNSPRVSFYKDKACNNADISLNSQVGNKTYNLEDFSKIQLEFRHQGDKYSEPGLQKNVEIVIQRPVIFDIDVSFPAGLLIQNLGKTETEKDQMDKYATDLEKYNQEFNAFTEALAKWDPNSGTTQPTFTKSAPTKPEKAAFTDNLGGISLALVAQFSFPDAHKVGKLKPYRLGAGFLAINAFNFSESAKRDLAAVALASLYPIKPGKIFNLPIHFGFGYKFQDKIPFIMLSPGIGVRF
jgi:hypothetical protein